MSCSRISKTPAGRGRPPVAGRDACSPPRRPCTRCRPPSIRRVATFHLRCTRAHPLCHKVALSVRTCAPTVSQRYTIDAHVRTHSVTALHTRCTRAHPQCHSVAALHTRCTRAHPQCHSVAPLVHTCAPTVSQRHTIGAHVRAYRVTALHPRCTHAHRPCRIVARAVRRCARIALPCSTPSFPRTALDNPFPRAYIVRYRVEDRKTSGFGGCRRYGRAE